MLQYTLVDITTAKEEIIIKKKKWVAVISLILILMLIACGQNEDTANVSGTESIESFEDLTNVEIVQSPKQYAMVVIMTINPQIKLYLDSENVIVYVEYLNEDAETAFADIGLANVTMEEGMGMIVHAVIEKEFLTDGKTLNIDVIEVLDENCDIEAVCTEMETAIVKAIDENNVDVAITTKVSAKIVEKGSLDAIEDTSSAFEAESKPELESTSDVEPILEPKPTSEANQTLEVEPTPEPLPETKESEPCSACGGTGICSECGGGTLPCKRCGGSLWEGCGVCGGDGNQTCPGCKGSGTMSADGSTCNYCGGAGGISCELCGGSGGKSCSICNGKGVVSDDCILCHGGKNCAVCGGTGKKQ